MLRINTSIQQDPAYIEVTQQGYRPEKMQNLRLHGHYCRKITYIRELSCCERMGRIFGGCVCSLIFCGLPNCSDEFVESTWKVGGRGIQQKTITHIDKQADQKTYFEEDGGDPFCAPNLSFSEYFKKIENRAKLVECNGHYYYAHITPSGTSFFFFAPYMNLEDVEEVMASFEDGSFFNSKDLVRYAEQYCRGYKAPSSSTTTDKPSRPSPTPSRPVTIIDVTTNKIIGKATSDDEYTYLLSKTKNSKNKIYCFQTE
jgi:hypothetical protein